MNCDNWGQRGKFELNAEREKETGSMLGGLDLGGEARIAEPFAIEPVIVNLETT